MSEEGEERQPKRSKGDSIQEKKEDKMKAEDMWTHIENNKNLLNHIKANKDEWKQEHFAYIREFCSHVQMHKKDFPLVMGDKYPDYESPPATEGSGIELTMGYITKVARREDTSSITDEPILQVVERETKYRGSSTVTQVQFTHLTLCDGDGNIIVGRVVTHLTHEARKLERGDIIKLPVFTELTHRIGNSNPMPALFIVEFRKIGYAIIPENVKQQQLSCDLSNSSDKSNDTPSANDNDTAGGNLQKDVSNAKCEFPNRLCSINGIQMIVCICKSQPVHRLNLNTIREDCYFATEEVDKMTNSQKRCMVYWWYATNVYSICGKGKRMMLPDCLVNAVRNTFTEEDGKYTGYCYVCS